jgi:IS30 family transposase
LLTSQGFQQLKYANMTENTVTNKSKNYSRISLLEREKIYKLYLEKKSQIEIAKTIGRNKSTISRELARCRDSDLGYIPYSAQEQAKQRKRRNPHLFRSAALLLLVGDALRKGWSPEQIAGRFKIEKNLKISHETIYKFAYSKEGKAMG